MVANTGEEIAEHFIEGNSGQEIYEEVWLNILHLDFLDIVNFFASLQILKCCPEVENYVHEIEEVNEKIESVNEMELSKTLITFKECLLDW